MKEKHAPYIANWDLSAIDEKKNWVLGEPIEPTEEEAARLDRLTTTRCQPKSVLHRSPLGSRHAQRRASWLWGTAASSTRCSGATWR